MKRTAEKFRLYTHCGALVDAVGFAVILTVVASSSGCSTENAVIEKSASRPWAVL